VYKIYIRERHYFSLVCTFKMLTKDFEIKVDIQKAPPSYKGKIDNTCHVSFIRYVL
jgi:hypothetical protein